jgi:hypothetical protein
MFGVLSWKKILASYTLASEALGLPKVQSMDAASTVAMWSDSNVNVIHQQITCKHLKFHFGKRLFIPKKLFKENQEHYNIETSYGSYKYYKNTKT